MKKSLARTALAAALTAASLAAPLVASAAAVKLTGWAYGAGGNVALTTGGSSSLASYSGAAGGFAGTLTGAGAFDTTTFLTYCIELEESFSFSRSAMTGYALVDGASYFAARRLANPLRPEGAEVAERLGRLFTWVQAEPARVDSAAESTALQLAVWNLIYDGDWSLSNPLGRFSDSSSHAAAANAMMAGARSTANRRDVFALSRSGKQDFIVTARRPGIDTGTSVPVPGTLALAALALAAAAGLRRVRRA